jgi:hypothetical protein
LSYDAEQQKEGLLNKLTGTGFDTRQAERAYMLSGGDVDCAIELCLFGM